MQRLQTRSRSPGEFAVKRLPFPFDLLSAIGSPIPDSGLMPPCHSEIMPPIIPG
jgi:hypothetical protein